VPKAVAFDFKPLMVRSADAVPNEDNAGFDPLKALKPPPNELPNALPPKVDLLEPPRAPNPLEGAAAGTALPAKELNLLPPAAAKGDLEPSLASAPNGEESAFAKLPKVDDLNFSSEVCGSSSGRSEAFGACGFGDMAAKGDSCDVFANPLPGGIYCHH
jgi:hypothetical protein